jgi:hypothetical protein
VSAADSLDWCANLLGSTAHRKVFFVGLYFSTTIASGDIRGSIFETGLSRPVISSAAENVVCAVFVTFDTSATDSVLWVMYGQAINAAAEGCI